MDPDPLATGNLAPGLAGATPVKGITVIVPTTDAASITYELVE